jgi:hypothetical protein
MTLPLRVMGLRLEKAWLLGSSLNGAADFWLQVHGERIHQGLFLARLVSVLFYAAGALLVGSWAGDLFGPWARRTAMALWCFNPLVLSHAMMAMVDVGAAVMGLAAARAFVSMLARPGWLRMLIAGLLLGLALASKFTLLALPGVFLCLALFRLIAPQPGLGWRVRMLGMVLGLGALAVPVIGACYFFHGLGVPLAGRSFGSQVFRSLQHRADAGGLAIPLDWLARTVPADYLGGLDFQWSHFESGFQNYFDGHIRRRGFWYYYLAGLGIKMPLGLWGVALAAVYRAARGAVGSRGDEECLLLAPLALFLVCQMNTTVTFLRYLMPVFPFVCTSLGRVAAGALPVGVAAVQRGSSPTPAAAPRPAAGAGARMPCWYVALAAGLLAATVASPLLKHPHYLGYCNELVGGAKGGRRYFGVDELDVGQDARRLADWQRRHPEARPMRVSLYSPFTPEYLGVIDDSPVRPAGKNVTLGDVVGVPSAPFIGYLAISVTNLNFTGAVVLERVSLPRSGHAFCRWLRDRTPLDVVGTSVLIYRFTEQDIKAFRRWQQENVPR